jgi:hypothetical protein
MRRWLAAGVVDTTRTDTSSRYFGRPVLVLGLRLTTGVRPGSMQESEGPIVLLKLVKASGGKGPWFRVRQGETRVRRLV